MSKPRPTTKAEAIRRKMARAVDDDAPRTLTPADIKALRDMLEAVLEKYGARDFI